MTEWREQLIARNEGIKVITFVERSRSKPYVVKITGLNSNSEWDFETREEARSLFDSIAKIIKAEPEIQIVEV